MKGGITRRKLLQMAGVATLSATASLVGCGQGRNESASSAAAEASETSAAASPSAAAGSSAAASSAEEASSSLASQPTGGESKPLVLTFSRAGENYGVGTVEVGNTMVLAQMIAEKTGADLFEIERATAYPAGYDDCCDEALEEQNAGARPELKALPDIAGYDAIYFGFPCWWGDLPMPVYTAVEALDWNGKTIMPFNTHAGSGESGMFSTLASKCSGATVTSGLTLSGETAQNNRAEAESSVDSWLAGLQ